MPPGVMERASAPPKVLRLESARLPAGMPSASCAVVRPLPSSRMPPTLPAIHIDGLPRTAAVSVVAALPEKTVPRLMTAPPTVPPA